MPSELRAKLSQEQREALKAADFINEVNLDTIRMRERAKFRIAATLLEARADGIEWANLENSQNGSIIGLALAQDERERLRREAAELREQNGK